MANNKRKGKAPAQAQVQTRSVGMRVLVIVALLVVIAAMVLMVMQFCTPYKPSKWFEKKGPSVELPEPTGKAGPSAFIMDDATEGDGIMLLSTPIAEVDFEAFAIAEEAESAKLITVRFTPDNTNVRAVTWNIRWDPTFDSDGWSSGKTVTDYVTLNVANNTTSAATVTCLQQFGHRVLIEVATVGDENVQLSASVTGDYVKSVTNVAVGFDKGNTVALGTNEVYKITLNAEYGVGTITPSVMTMANGVCELVLSDSAKAYLESENDLGGSYPAYPLNAGGPGITSENYLVFAVYGTASTATASVINKIKSAFVNSAYGFASTAATLRVEVATVYNGAVLESNVYENAGIAFNVTALRVYAEGIEISGDTLIWGI